MKITILAAAIAATTAAAALPVVPAAASGQHCYTTQERICRPTQHGTTICQTTTKRHCVNNNNHMRKKESLKDRFISRSGRNRNRNR